MTLTDHLDALAAHWTSTDADTLFRAALTRRAWLLENAMPEGRHHEPLEWLGDRALDLVVAEELWRRFPFADEGRLDIARAHLCGEPLLADVGRQVDIVAAVHMGVGERQEGQVTHDRAVSDHLEAVIGAAWLAGGIDGARALVHRLLAGRWPDELPTPAAQGGGLADPMSRLSRLVQQRWRTSLSRKDAWTVDHSGPDHARTWTATVTLPDGQSFRGPPVRGRRDAARAAAAAAALDVLDASPT